MNKETRQFIAENIEADIHQLAFQAARYPMVNMAFAICQINGMQKVKAKIPLFFNTEDVLYPVQLSLSNLPLNQQLNTNIPCAKEIH